MDYFYRIGILFLDFLLHEYDQNIDFDFDFGYYLFSYLFGISWIKVNMNGNIFIDFIMVDNKS